MKDLNNYSLRAHNTFGIDARCRRFLEYESADEAREVARLLRESGEPFLIIGGGSNLLLTRDFEGTVVHSAIRGIRETLRVENMVFVECGSGELWDDVVAYSISQGWNGAENLSLIPGEVGASAVQNIGAYGMEVCDLVHSVHAVRISDGGAQEFLVDDCGYAYRQSRFKREWRNQFLITSVEYWFTTDFVPQLDYGNIRAELERRGVTEPTADVVRQAIISIRNAKLPDPKVTGNAGSFFMNPIVSRSRFEQLLAQYPQMPHYPVDAEHEKIPAGWMIEQCGWKGRSLGRAGVHDRQALVLVNRGGATGAEVVALCEAIRNDVRDKFGINIEPEVNIV